MSPIKTLKNTLKLWLLALSLVWFFSISTTFAANDLLKELMAPAKDQSKTTFDLWENVESVWKEVFEWRVKVGANWDWVSAGKSPSIIVRTTRLILSLVVALSITMILYNWMMYIMQTMNWKDWKSLVKNVIYIAVWIIIALFSVVIITIIQSVPQTLKEWLDTHTNIDEEQAGEPTAKSRKEIWQNIKNFMTSL